MLYGRIGYGNNPFIKGQQLCNLGDVFQTLAVDEVYRRMGIDEKSVRTISRYDLETYDGPELTLVMNAWFGHGYPGVRIKHLSSKIRPVYFGFHCISKRNIPTSLFDGRTHVGCRDEGTYRLMLESGIPAFLSGCSTLLFDKRPEDSTADKVYCIDVPESISAAAAQVFGSDSIVIRHQSIPVPGGLSISEEWQWCDSQSRSRIQEYRDHAALVVTTRLHCTLPCVAMGIPVILIREHYDERFEWVEKFTRLYTNDMLSDVDWHPSSLDISDFKQLSESVLEAMIRGDSVTADQLHEYFETRKKENIEPPLKLVAYNALHERFPNLAEFLRLKVLAGFSMEEKSNK